MDGLIAYALSKKYADSEIQKIINAGFRVQVEQDRNILETTGEEKIFYFLPKNPQKPKDGYDEFVYTNNDWEQVGVTDIDLSVYALKSEIPTKVSQLQNDSGFLIQHQDISGKADKATTLSGYGITDAQSKIDTNNKLSSDLIDDTNNTNKFVTTSEKTTWSEKYDKPNSGIPKTDLSEEVQTSLGKADTALQTHQDISGKADKSTTLSGYGITDAQIKIDSNNKLSSDLVDDANSTNKFVTSQEKTGWDSKYSKPNGGIPKSDLDSSAQASLGKADTALQSYTEQYTGTVIGVTMNGNSLSPTDGIIDLGAVITAHQDIGGKADKATTLAGYGITDGETTSHKVTAITSGANNTMYPSALAVYNALSGKESTGNKSTSIGSGSSHTQYPTSKAVYDYVTTVIQGKADKTDTYTKTEVDTALSGKANTSDIPDISGKADKATTLAGYGITDAYKKVDINQMFNQVDADLQAKADQSNTYSKTEVDTKLSGKANTSDIPDVSGKADKATTLSGYGINNAYTKTQTNTLLNAKESTANKVTAVDSSATDTQYPSAKAVYTELSGKADKSNTYTKSEVDTLVSGGVIPQYVIDESESVLAKAFAHKGLGRTIRFIAVSDSHNDATKASHDYTRVSNLHCGQAVKYIADRIPLDFVASLGDMTWAGVAHTTAQYQTNWLKADIQEMNMFLKDGFSGVPNIRVVGNHDQCATTDSGGTVSRLQNSGAYQYFGRYNAGANDGLSNYGYYDIDNVKLRIIYLNTSDAVSTSTQGTLLSVSQEQKNWLCETLIDVNSKTNAADWKILLLSHAPLDMVSGIAADILIPYTNGGTYGSYTFTNHNAKIIGNCHGHTHCYRVDYMADKIRRFTIPNSNFYDNNHYKNNTNYSAWNEDTIYPKTENSRTDTSFSLVTIDLDSLTCYVDNYGAGYDREFSLDYKSAPAPANLFDKDDPDVILRARFNSSMQPVDFADEQLVTGFVPASVGTSFTIETDKANNTNGYTGFIMLYNSSKQPIGGLSNATTPFVWSSDYKSGTVTIPQSYINTNFEGTEYARFCLAYVDIGNIEIYNE